MKTSELHLNNEKILKNYHFNSFSEELFGFSDKLNTVKGKNNRKKVSYKCNVPDFNREIEVVAYTADKEQERILNKLCRNVYKFQRFALEHSIFTVWTNPMSDTNTKQPLTADFFNKMALIFECFELQEDYNNTKNLSFWIGNLTPENIDDYSRKFNLNPKVYCTKPYKKIFWGVRDSYVA